MLTLPILPSCLMLVMAITLDALPPKHYAGPAYSEVIDSHQPSLNVVTNMQRTWLKYLLAKARSQNKGMADYLDSAHPAGPVDSDYFDSAHQADLVDSDYFGSAHPAAADSAKSDYLDSTHPAGPAHTDSTHRLDTAIPRKRFTEYGLPYFKYKRNNGVWIWMPAQGYVSVPKDQQAINDNDPNKQGKIMRYGK